MTLLTILLLAFITFFSRYIFLHPKLPLKIGAKLELFLSFSAPAVLTAIWVPIVFIRDHTLDINLSNPYLLGATVAIVTAWKTNSVYLTLAISAVVFITIKLYVA